MKIALLGCGNVGADVVRLLHAHADELATRIGAPLELAGIAVRRPQRYRDLPVAAELYTDDADALVAREDVDIVVEVIGGLEPARRLILAALARKAGVVTANKALLAADGAALFAAARRAGADLAYEASVGGGIPLLRPLGESLAGDRVTRLMGIVNGTTNYVLSRMEQAGVGFAEALEEAQALGFAEADPSADVEGFDAAAKAAILTGLAFHTRVDGADVYREGITAITAADIGGAAELGGVLKPLAIAERADEGRGVSVRVHPAVLPRTHPLAAVGEAFNAVFVQAEAAGPLMFYGRGAGGLPSASAVLGDIVAVARNQLTSARTAGESAYAELPVVDMSQTLTRYYVRLDVADKAGVLATVAGAFADHDVSIQTVRQQGRGDDAALAVVTHVALDGALAATVRRLRELDVVRAVTSVLRVEGEVET